MMILFVFLSNFHLPIITIIIITYYVLHPPSLSFSLSLSPTFCPPFTLSCSIFLGRWLGWYYVSHCRNLLKSLIDFVVLSCLGDIYYSSVLEEMKLEGQDFKADSWSMAVDSSYLQTHSKTVIKRQDVIYGTRTSSL